MTPRQDHFVLRINWDEVGKRWRLSYVVQLQRGVASHWRWVETREPLDAYGARSVARAVAREMEGWLPLFGQNDD